MNRRKYTLLQALYWCSAASLFCFAVSFMRALGFSNAQVGLVAALGNLLGFSGSILLGTEIDRGRLRLFSAATAALGLLIAAACSLVLHSGRDLFTGLFLIICFACSLSLNPLYIKIAGLIQKADSDLSFGLSRGVGSLAFALTALAMGALVQMLSTSIIPIAIVCTAVIQLPVLLSLHRVCAHVDLGEKKEEGKASLLSFMRAMPRFCLLLLGIAVIFAANNTVNNFLINVVQNLRGNYADLGRLSFFSAVIEFPAMLAYSRLSTKMRKRCLRLSLLFFPIKLLAISLAGSVPALFAAYLFHGLSFGLYTPAIVDYVERTVPAADSAKGQTMTAAAASLGTIAATLAGGIMLDRLSVQSVLLILTLTAAFGAVLGLLATRNREQN